MGEAGIIGGGKDGSFGVMLLRGGDADAFAVFVILFGNPTGLDPFEGAGEEEGVT